MEFGGDGPLVEDHMARYAVTRRIEGGKVIAVHRMRIDSARLAFQMAVWCALRSQALLDTKHAHEVSRLARDWDEGQGLRVGQQMVCWWRYA